MVKMTQALGPRGPFDPKNGLNGNAKKRMRAKSDLSSNHARHSVYGKFYANISEKSSKHIRCSINNRILNLKW